MHQAQAWVVGRWAQLKRDVWDDPTIRPVAAVLLSALAGLTIVLTKTYAPQATDGGGEITPETGVETIAIVMALTIAAGVEPYLARWIEDGWWSRGRRGFHALPGPIRVLAIIVADVLIAPAKIASVVWSFLDFLLARGVAFLVGATADGAVKRYARFAGVIVLAVAVALLAAERRLPFAAGLAAIGVALVCILAVVRRWSWFEGDRDTYLIERGERRGDAGSRRPSTLQLRREAILAGVCILTLGTGLAVLHPRLPMPHTAYAVAVLTIPLAVVLGLAAAGRWADPGQSALRVGFREDLRDEALFALACLFVLIPLGLDLVQLASCAQSQCAFTPNDPNYTIPEALGARLWLWLGFFGAELAKTVPFVDWSEVFHVANASPIRPTDGPGVTPLGAQVVFVMRAALDLLLLATVVQAIGIASRLREQSTAFKNNQLPILEPFAEARELSRAARSIVPELDVLPTAQHAIASFPTYDEQRLKDLIEGADDMPERVSKTKPLVRRAAVALLSSQYKGEETDRFLFDRARAETDGPLQAWIATVASGVVPDGRTGRDRATLNQLLVDPIAEPSVRAAAARRLGRLRPERESVRLLFETVADPNDERIAICADAAVALAKLAPDDPAVRERLVELVGRINRESERSSRGVVGERLLPAMATAHALARLGMTESFAKRLEAHTARAARIQIEAMGTEAARDREIGARTEQMVRITPGTPPFPRAFLMGSVKGAETDPQVIRFIRGEYPQTQIEMGGAFAIGRFPVTNREYLGYTEAMERKPLEKADRTDHPAVEVTWHDANAYAGWLERITGERWRLPSEAEWEYVCRAGTSTPFWWGDRWDATRGNIQDPSIGTTTEVNKYAPNPWGIWDMFGNVYEWCADQGHANHEHRPDTSAVWPALRDSDLPHRRVVRGGSWSFPPPTRVRSAAYRNDQVSTYVGTQYGFRLVRELNG